MWGPRVRFGARSPNDLLFRSSNACTPLIRYVLHLFLLVQAFYPFLLSTLIHLPSVQSISLSHVADYYLFSNLLPRTFFLNSLFLQLMLFVCSWCSLLRFTLTHDLRFFNSALELIILFSYNIPFNWRVQKYTKLLFFIPFLSL